MKVRGFRVEVGEVEAVLAGLPGVRQAVVVAREGVGGVGGVGLAGYVVGEVGVVLDGGVLRRGVAGVLPDYMVPSACVVVDALPLLPNGKVDRARLPAPRYEPAAGGRAPRTPAEEILCGLFAEVLGVAPAGIDDSFFDLGGQSLKAIRLVNRIRSALAFDLDIRDVFAAPTPAGLAAAMTRHRSPSRLPLRQAPRPRSIPLSFAQSRLWFLNQLEGPSPVYNIPMVWRVSGGLSAGALRAALHDVAARHESLRTMIGEADGTARQLIAGAAAAHPELEVRQVTRDELATAVGNACHYAFDLSAELPIRGWLFEVADGEYVLALVVHHIATDEWSARPLLGDLSAAYRARQAGTPPAWPPLPVQYADYALWQRELLGGAGDPDSELSGQLDFWRTYLAGLPSEIALPSLRSRPAVPSYQGGTVAVDLGADLHSKLRALALAEGVTLFMVAQAAVAVLLSRLGAGMDVPIGAPVAGRTDEALDELVGFFVNTLVLRTDVSGNPPFTELLARVRQADLAAFAHQDVPFERLVEVLNPARSAARHPLFQVMLSVADSIEAGLTLPGLDVRAEHAGTSTAKFDLTFTFTDCRPAGGGQAGITARILYASDLFTAGEIEVLAGRLLRVLGAVTTSPDAAVSDIEVLGPAERELILHGWSGTAPPRAPAGTLPALFAAQAALTPAAVAVASAGQDITYAHLDATSDELAQSLKACGAGPETPVLVLMERSAELVLTLLAVVKTGGFYVPADPAWPAARVRFVAGDTRTGVIVCDGGLAGFARQACPTARVLTAPP
ncbi:MAG TPA: condensation domain-containing protein, partial [Streptosporangiaceae bacterium]